MRHNFDLPLVLITGASSGIGAATARKFSKEGHPVVLLARRQELLFKLQKELENPSFCFKVDVTNRVEVESSIEQIERTIGPVAILINNAGGAFGLDPAPIADLDDWKKCVDVNINGLLYVTRALLPHLVNRNEGHIINLGSVAGSYPYPGGNVYGAAKAFVEHFSLNLRADLLGKNIRVSCIEPGLTAGTEFSLVRFKGDEKSAEKVYQNTQPLQAEDIAEVIYFCTRLPKHVNINMLEMMPVAQAFSALSVDRK